MRPLLIILAVIVLLVIGKFVFFGNSQSGTPTTSPGTLSAKASQALPVNIYLAKEELTSNTVYASGTIVANEEVELRSEVSGRLVKLSIAEGSLVQKGQVIAKLNDDELLAQLKKLEYEEQLAAQIEARQKKLLDINAISKEEYDMAMNRVNTLSADKELLQVQIAKTAIKAPFSGRIGLKNISEGAYITPNEIIANIIQTNPVKIDFPIPEKYANLIQKGQKVQFMIDGTDEIFEATVIAIDPRVDEVLRTLKIRASYNNSGGKMLPGMFVRVTVPLGSEKSIMVPTEAVVPILKGKKVYVIHQGKAKEAIVQTGLRTDKSVQVLEGLSVGDSVIVSGLMSLKEDSPVTLRELVN
ncbi:MAG: efflux RND transporter periplasmic adaptor subunit [Bacteroidia bacterium]|nr:efflux RND transporter periplasmic adaptor subunit [Bacteroidia bacterium]